MPPKTDISAGFYDAMLCITDFDMDKAHRATEAFLELFDIISRRALPEKGL